MKRKKSEKPHLKNQTLNCLFEPETRTWEQPDLRGQTFGRLSVKEPADRRNPQIVIWWCVTSLLPTLSKNRGLERKQIAYFAQSNLVNKNHCRRNKT